MIRRAKRRDPAAGPSALGNVYLTVTATGDRITVPYVYVGVVDGAHHYEAVLTAEHSELAMSGQVTLGCDVLPARSALSVRLGSDE